MKYGIITCLVALIFAAMPVFADECDTQIAEVEAVINNTPGYNQDQLEQAKELLLDAKQECRSNTPEDEASGLALLLQIKVLLGLVPSP